MDNKGNPSRAGKSEADGKPNEKSSNRKGKSKKSIKWKIPVAVWVAVIGSITTIAVALINSPRNPPGPTPTFIPILSQTPFFIGTATPLFTSTPYLVNLPSITDTPTVTVTATDTPTVQASPAPVLIARLVADKTSGKPPLIVKFDARDSFLRESNGIQFSCQAGPCYYTWRVYSNGQQIGKSANNSSGKFEYTFRERGTYTVTVYICRGQDREDCGDSGIWVEVTS